MYLLSNETKSKYLDFGVPFYQAAIRGECTKALGVCELYPDIVRSRITREWETGLHIAAAARNLPFVKMLVGKMTPADIALPNKFGNTALCFAAASGVVDIAKEMVAKDDRLPLVRGNEGMTPLHMAALLGHRDMVLYLLPFTDKGNQLTSKDLMELFISLINTHLYALQLQRELLWLQEVEKIVQPLYTERKNKDNLTPKDLFVSDHKELVKEGEAWMKNTAQSCMLVATLIATVMFAAAFTLPGGTADDGTPNY
ncbi:hypothetical protein QQ045_016328 [Rhodiola kirilowii]